MKKLLNQERIKVDDIEKEGLQVLVEPALNYTVLLMTKRL